MVHEEAGPPRRRRDFIWIAAVTFVGVGAVASLYPFAANLAPNASSPKPFTDIDVSDVPPRSFRLVSWQGKPVLIRRWSATEPWIVTQGECNHCACLLRPIGDLPDPSHEWILCPCCASRFQFQGKRLSGPANTDLRAIAFRLTGPQAMRIG